MMENMVSFCCDFVVVVFVFCSFVAFVLLLRLLMLICFYLCDDLLG